MGSNDVRPIRALPCATGWLASSKRLLLVMLVLSLGRSVCGQDALPIPKPVRSSTKWGVDLIAEGMRRAPAFRALVEHLAGRHIIVYVEPVAYLPPLMDGVTHFSGVAGPYRYLRVSLRLRGDRHRLISLLGHELQHAFEVAQAPEVVDKDSFEALYRRIGDTNENGYDTDAARRAGDQVMQELLRSAPLSGDPPLPPAPKPPQH